MKNAPKRVKGGETPEVQHAINTIRRVSGMVGVFNWMVEAPTPVFSTKMLGEGRAWGRKIERHSLRRRWREREREREMVCSNLPESISDFTDFARSFPG